MFKKEYIPWNKDKKMSDEYRKKCRMNRLGKHHSEETKKKISNIHKKIGVGLWMKGRKRPLDVRKRISEHSAKIWLGKKLPYKIWNKGKKYYQISGKNHWNWQGGKILEKEKIRKSIKYKNWRRIIFIRDDYACQKCGIKSVNIQVHHIKSWSKFPTLRFNIGNGITLCKVCHKKTNNYGEKAKLTKNELDAILN